MTVFKKWIERLRNIALGGAYKLLSSFGNVIVSFFVVREHSPELWGEMVSILVIIDFGFSIVAWGSTPFLIREFSLHPNQIRQDWATSTSSRLALLLVLFVFLIFLSFPPMVKIYVIGYCLFRFISQSLEPFIQNERNFALSLAVELSAMAFSVFFIIVNRELTISSLLLIFLVTIGYKCLVFTFYFRRKISFSKINFEFFTRAFPFLLLTFSAMLQQRADLYCVNYFLDHQSIARYQVFLSFMIFSQFGASLLLSPYAKNIFRLNRASFLKLERKFIFLGALLSLMCIATIYVLIQYLYQFPLSWKMYALGYFYIFMFYLYLLRNYEMGKLNKQIYVSIYSLVCSLLTIALGVILTPSFGIEGAFLAAVLSQIFLVCLYHFRKPLVHAQG